MNEISAARLRDLLLYDPETGQFVWRVKRSRSRAGESAGFLTENGYKKIRVEQRGYMAHRLAWLYTYGEWPNGEVDHINGVRSDNRVCNIRVVSRTVNAQNQRTPHAGKVSSTLLGVYWSKARQRWQARLHMGKRNVHLGYFDTEDMAYQAYVVAKRIMHPGCMI